MSKRDTKPLRSQETRDRVLIAARQLFADQGFERTTIRAIAAASAIHPSMVMRYYNSKEALFAAAAAVDFRIPDLAALPPATRGVALVTHILDRWEDAHGELQVILRAAGTYELARRRLVDLVERQAVPAIRSILPSDRTDERLGLIIMHITGLVLGRYFLRHSSVTALGRETIIHQVGAALQVQMD